MTLESVFLAGGVGAAAGVGGTLLYFRLVTRQGRGVGPPTAALKAAPGPTAVATAELEKHRREVKAILVEKELLASALTRVYEAETEGRITREEREMLAKKYREQLRAVDESLTNAEVFIEVGELERLRDDLVGLFERKISQIEGRLQEAKARLDQLRGVRPPVAVEVKAEEKRVERRRAKPETSEAEERVKALREEVLEAMERLEQMDIEG